MANRLPEKLVQLRKHYGYSQGDIAEKVNVPVTEYIKWENGSTIPLIAQISYLAKFYGIQPDALVDNTKTIVFRQIQSVAETVDIPFLNEPVPDKEQTEPTEIFQPDEKEDTAPLEETRVIDTQQFAPTVANVIVDEPTKENDIPNEPEEQEDKKKITMGILAGAAALIVLIGALILFLNNKPKNTPVSLSGTNRLAVGDTYLLYIDKNGALQTKGSFAQTEKFSGSVQVSAYGSHAMGLRTDGTAVDTRNDSTVTSWDRLIMIAAGKDHSAALKKDGTVVCSGNTKACDVSSWKNIKAVYAGNGYTIGIKEDGTVVTSGTDYASNETSADKAVIGNNAMAVIRKDGTVAVYGASFDTSYWKNIEEAAIGNSFIVGVGSNGETFVADSDETRAFITDSWADIRYIAANGETVIAADRAGNLHGAGDNTYGLYNEAENPTPEITAPTEALPQVTDITFAETTANVTVRWNPSANAEYYSVSVEPELASPIPNTRSTSVSIPASALQSGQIYKVTVTAFPADANAWLPSEPVTVEYTYNAKTIQLDTPSNITCHVAENGMWHVSWDAVKNAGIYVFVLDGGEDAIISDNFIDLPVEEYNLIDNSTHNISVTALPADEASPYTGSEPAKVQLTFQLKHYTVTVSFNDPGNGSLELSLPAGSYVLKDLIKGELLPDGYVLSDPEKNVTIKGDTYLDVSVEPADPEQDGDLEGGGNG